MLYLHSQGVSTGLAVKIYKQYGEAALEVVRTDPYRLARDIRGVGFKTADRLAQSLGLPRDHPARLEAGLVYALNEMSDEGHVYAPWPAVLEEAAARLLGGGDRYDPPAVDRLAQDERVRLELLPFSGEGNQGSSASNRVGETSAIYQLTAVYLPPMYYGENGVAVQLRQLADALPTRLSDLPPAFVKLDPSLSDEQQSAIRTAMSHPVSVLTGGPGTGKTTALKALIAALESAHKTCALASPTGRAAKRLSEATGRPASTIHRLLGFSPQSGFRYNRDEPLPVDLLVLDEASMLDLLLANNLLKALQPGTHLLLVGDVDQLPSVGAGDVLRDVIASGIAPVTRLSAIFRQAAGSQIITNAHRVNQGKLPVFPPSGEGGDCFLFPAETAEEAARGVQEVVCQRIPARFGLHPRLQVQVLAPMYRGPAG
jgi:exodeoxyribonuclease V alpha subunit